MGVEKIYLLLWWEYIYICGMKKKIKKNAPKWENVKLPTDLVEMLRQHKKETFVPVGKTVEIAVRNYLTTIKLS